MPDVPSCPYNITFLLNTILESPVMRIAKILLTLLFSAAFTVCAANAQKSNMQNNTESSSSAMAKTSGATTSADTKFLRTVGQADLAEIELGTLAEQKATNPEVKQFAQRMVQDHTKNREELQQVAAEQHVTVPDMVTPKDKATKAQLEKLSGAQFDKAYMNDMLKDHRTDVAEVAHACKTAQNPAVKSFAQKTLPVLESHLKEAEKVAPQAGATQSASR
jgi:putative membrane protein